MKKKIFYLIKPALLFILAVEKFWFYRTGRKMRMLSRYHKAEGRYIQKQINAALAAKNKS